MEATIVYWGYVGGYIEIFVLVCLEVVVVPGPWIFSFKKETPK